jgi:hypothetical protein
VIVAIEMVRGRFCGRRRVEACAVYDENVRPSVVVVVKDGDAGSGGFKDVFLGVDAAENHGLREASLFGHVCKMSNGFGIAFRELTGAEKKGERKEQSERNAR